MAIKEFIIGPQSYWEEGYFSGDYTLPNVSKTFLECDIDNIKGGRVVTGLYYEDNYIDGTYWHDNSIRAELSVDAMIVQEATVAAQGYYQEGYYGSGYYETRGSVFVLTAELERAGELVEAIGMWGVEFNQLTTAVKTVESQTALAVEFTQTAYGARDRDIDMFAFNEAAIAIEISVVRDNNIAASIVFDIATDGRRFRDISAEEDSLFDFSVINERNREFNIETQVAFSFEQDYQRVRFADSQQSSTSDLTAIISHIEGADIIVSGFATLSADVIKNINISINLSISINTEISVSRLGYLNCSISSNSFLIADPYEYPKRGISTYSGNTNYSSIGIDLGNKKLGAGSLRLNTTSGSDFPTSGFHPQFFNNEWWHFTAGTTYRSSDGISWSSQSNNLPSGITKVNRANTYWATTLTTVVPGYEYTNITLYYSTDGISFTSKTVSEDSWRRTLGQLNSPVLYIGGYYYVFYTSAGGWRSVRTSSLTSPSWNTGGSHESAGGFGMTSGASPKITEAFDNILIRSHTGGPVTNNTTIVSVSGTTWTTVAALSGESAEKAWYSNGVLKFISHTGKLYSWTPAGGFVNHNIIINNLYNTYNTTGNWKGYTGYGGVYINEQLQSSSLTYSDSSGDLANFKTLDFWLYAPHPNVYTDLITISDGNKKFRLFAQLLLNLQLNNGSGDVSLTDSSYLKLIYQNNWYHIRIVQDNGIISGYVDGTRVFTSSYNPPVFGNVSVQFNTSHSQFSIDELLISDIALNSPSLTSFTVPNKQWINDSNTDLLLHFDGSLIDDSRISVIPQASITTISSLQINTTVDYNSDLGSLQSNSSVVCLGQKSTEIILSAFTNAALTANVDKIKEATSTQTTDASLTTSPSKTVENIISTTSEFTQASIEDRLRDGIVSTEAIATEMAVAVKVADFFVNADVVTIQQIEAIITASGSANIIAESTLSVDVNRTRDNQSSSTIEFTQVANASQITDFIVLTSSEFNEQVTAMKLNGGAATLAAEFTVDATTQGTIDSIILTASAGTLTVTVNPIRETSVALDVITTQYTDTYDSLSFKGEADLVGEFTQTSQEIRIRSAEITTESVASNLIIAAKVASYFINCDVVANMQVNAVKITENSSDFENSANLAIIPSKLHGSAEALLNAAFETQVDGTTNLTGEIAAEVTATVDADVMIISRPEILLLGATSLSISVDRLRGFASLEMSSGTLDITFDRIRDVETHFESIAIELSDANKVVSTTINMNSQFGLVAIGRDLRLDVYVWKIQRENRTFVINAENRNYRIPEETRIYKIRRY